MLFSDCFADGGIIEISAPELVIEFWNRSFEGGARKSDGSEELDNVFSHKTTYNRSELRSVSEMLCLPRL